MNEIIQNRVLRGFLTLFIGVMLALSLALLLKSFLPAPDTITVAWMVSTFLILFASGVGLAVASTVWRVQLAVLSGGLFLAGILAAGDATLLNIDGLTNLDVLGSGGPRHSGVLLVVFALIATCTVLGLGYWRFHGDQPNRDGQRFYTILAALLPVWLVLVTTARVVARLNLTDNRATVTYCAAFFGASVVLLAVGMLFSRTLELIGNVLTLSAVIMAFASVIASLQLNDYRATALIALAATAVAMFVGYQAFSRRGEIVESVGARTVAAGVELAGDDVLVLYASGETPPADAKLVEVPIGEGLVFRGFASRRPR